MKNFLLWKFILFFSVLTIALTGQENQQIKISGYVYNAETHKPLHFAQLVSYKTYLSYTTDTIGKFNILLGRSDSLKIVSMGFEGVVVKAEDFLKTEGPDTIFLRPASYLLNEVLINPRQPTIRLNLPGNIGANVDPDAEPDRFIPKPSVELITSPVTLAYSVFSKRAKKERKLKKEMAGNRQKAVWYSILSSDKLEQWTGLKGKELDDFIIYCNTRISVSGSDNELSIQRKVMDLLENYKRQN